MLEPQTRATLTDLLHPPAGFSLAHAVGTTYTLDLDSALMIPLSFAARRYTAADETAGLLDAVRRAADRVDIFTQAGLIGVGPQPSRLVTLLESMVHPVVVPSGILHPKVWFLEFARGDERAYRFVCASRNLTADRSWDVVVALDGTPAEEGRREAAAQRNAPLTALLRWLPRHAVVGLAPDRGGRIAALADRWAGVEWEAPADMGGIAFHVWGIGPRPALDLRGARGLLITPFVTDDGVRELTSGITGPTTLVSRGASIDGLQAATLERASITPFVLDDAANPTSDVGEDARAETLSGLHAKVCIVDRGHKQSRVLLGSLNATGPALHQNVEVMVELTGSTRKFGVEATSDGLGDFIQEYPYTGGVTESADEAADRDLSRTLGAIAAVPLHARVVGDGQFALEFWRDGAVSLPPDVDVSWHPMTRTGFPIAGLPGLRDEPSIVAGLELVEITPFVIVTVRDNRGDRAAQRTVVLAQLHDDPADRRDAIIASQLDRQGFLRFVMLLLELGGADFGTAGGGGVWGPSAGGGGTGSGLFEALLRAVGRESSGLADLERIVAQLRRHADGEEVLPDGFEALWDAVWTAERRIAGARHG